MHLSSVFAKDPKNIALFLQAMAPRSWGQGDVFPRVGELDEDQLKNIERIFDLDALAQLIRQQLPSDFEDPQWFPDSSKAVDQRLAEQFIFVYNKLKKEEDCDDEPDKIESAEAVGESGEDQGTEQAEAANLSSTSG